MLSGDLVQNFIVLPARALAQPFGAAEQTKKQDDGRRVLAGGAHPRTGGYGQE
jgi:hypothetical protein